MKLNILEFIPDQINNIPVKTSSNGDFIEISRKGTGSPKPITVKKEIEMNDFFMEVIGLYFGDGLNTRKGTGNRRTAFANSNYELQLQWINFLERTGLKKEALFAQLSIGKNHQYKNKEILEYWINKTNLPSNVFSKISNNKEISCQEGILSLEFNSIICKQPPIRDWGHFCLGCKAA